MSFALKPGMLPLYDNASEASIESFEKEYGYKLPDDYRRFLREVNGFQRDTSLGRSLFFPIKERWIKEHNGWPDVIPPFIWPPVGEVFAPIVGEPTAIKGLLNTSVASDTDSSYSIMVGDSSFDFALRMPKQFLVIGYTFHPELICLDCSEEAFGRVLFWNADYDPEATAEEELERLECIADTFQEFWDSLILLDEREMLDWHGEFV